MAKEGMIRVEGTVVETLSNVMLKAELENRRQVLVIALDKVRICYICILPGDRVAAELSPYDLTRGRIAYHFK